MANPPTKIDKGLVVKPNRQILNLRRSLVKEKFDPVKQLIRYVYPQLEPEQQANICLKLMEYCFPKAAPPKTATPRTKKGVQNNIQINLPNQPAPPTEHELEEMVRIASSSDDTK